MFDFCIPSAAPKDEPTTIVASNSELETKAEQVTATENTKMTSKHLPFTFDSSSSSSSSSTYKYPTLYEEADSMMQIALLIYTITDLRTLAKQANTKKQNLATKFFGTRKMQNPERILTLPFTLKTCLEMIEENVDLIQKEFGDDDHIMTINALQSLQQRYERNANNNKPNSNVGSTSNHQWWNPFRIGSTDGNVEVEVKDGKTEFMPRLVAYGDEKPESELVYGVGVDPVHKRVTVAFRGSVTATDFLTDAQIALCVQPNPVKDLLANNNDNENGDSENSQVLAQMDQLAVHNGFYEYLLKPNKKTGVNKYQEILKHVLKIFQDDPETFQSYKLYVTGHSLGGALATLFSFYVAASVATKDPTSAGDESLDTSIIPTPITCVSVASPRVGEGSFQSAHRLLEHHGMLRHLRIANDTDPVTMMPKTSGKMIWAMLSPISYMAFKLMDRKFEEKETYRHTGIKLRLSKPNPTKEGEEEEKEKEATSTKDDSQEQEEVTYEIAYSSAKQAKEETSESKMSKTPSFNKAKVPDVIEHLGKAYCDNLLHVEQDLQSKQLTLNQLYQSHAAPLCNKCT